MGGIIIKIRGNSAQKNSKINRNLSKYLTQLLKGLSKKDYQSGGIDKLKEIKFYQPKSELGCVDISFWHPPKALSDAVLNGISLI